MPYVRYSMRGTVEGSIKHEAKSCALLFSRSYSGALYVFCIYSGQKEVGSYKLCITDLEWKDIYVHSCYIMINFDSLYAKYLVLLTHKTFHKAK